jgi:hypothetical protein
VAILKVERIGGLAGFGIPGGHLRSRGQLDVASLSTADRRTIEGLFKAGGGAQSPRTAQTRDGFCYRISRATPSGTETIELHESVVPTAVIACVKDVLE